MKKSSRAQERAVHALMGEKTRLLTQAQALSEIGMEEAAHPLWLEIADREERIAPLLEAMGRDREAALHRISAASCFEKVGEDARAANLYQASLAGPLLDHTRQEVEAMLRRCLERLLLRAASARSAPTRRTTKSLRTT